MGAARGARRRVSQHRPLQPGRGALVSADEHRSFEITREPEDIGKFKAPTLRNIAVTAPYMHDGSVATLEEVIDHYAAGGRTITAGPNAGVGNDNPNKSARSAALHSPATSAPTWSRFCSR